jgi:hypothetical protein
LPLKPPDASASAPIRNALGRHDPRARPAAAQLRAARVEFPERECALEGGAGVSRRDDDSARVVLRATDRH